MNSQLIDLLLADDDTDDRLVFKEVLDELPLTIQLTTVTNGEQLMRILRKKEQKLPHLLFLDLNMPLKNGFECLVEIRLNENLKDLPVIVYSTSFDPEMITLLYQNGAQYYIKKPTEFSKLKRVIYDALSLTANKPICQPDIDKFVLES